ncbi:MAG: hypothetical protein ACPH5G_17360, partial [Pseudooceanicola atlanticus]
MSEQPYGGGEAGADTYEIFVRDEIENGRAPLERSDWIKTKAKPNWQPEGGENWTPDFAYEARMLTYYKGKQWQAIVDNTGIEPGSSDLVWLPFLDVAATPEATDILTAAQAEKEAALVAKDAAVAAQGGSETALSQTQAARAAAELAAQAAAADAQAFADIATGVAQTAEGAYFRVLDGAADYVTTYRVEGGIAVEKVS